MTKAGEESGNLADSLSNIGLNLEKSHYLTKKYEGLDLSGSDLVGNGGDWGSDVRFCGPDPSGYI